MSTPPTILHALPHSARLSPLQPGCVRSSFVIVIPGRSSTVSAPSLPFAFASKFSPARPDSHTLLKSKAYRRIDHMSAMCLLRVKRNPGMFPSMICTTPTHAPSSSGAFGLDILSIFILASLAALGVRQAGFIGAQGER
eukprot:12428001-Karenia_brevis.AAC.1